MSPMTSVRRGTGRSTRASATSASSRSDLGSGTRCSWAASRWWGPGFRGGELGHLRLDLRDDAIRCSCGGSGHLGGIASGRATVAWIKTEAAADRAAFEGSHLWSITEGSSDRIDGPAVAKAFAARDPWVTQQIRARARFLGGGAGIGSSWGWGGGLRHRRGIRSSAGRGLPPDLGGGCRCCRMAPGPGLGPNGPVGRAR